jgi:hypothetical protein
MVEGFLSVSFIGALSFHLKFICYRKLLRFTLSLVSLSLVRDLLWILLAFLHFPFVSTFQVNLHEVAHQNHNVEEHDNRDDDSVDPGVSAQEQQQVA